jgi:arginase
VKNTIKQTLFLGTPFYAGQSYSGTKLAPDMFRNLNNDLFTIFGWQDLGNISAPQYHGRQAGIDQCYSISEFIRQQNLKDQFLCIMGGDHGQSLGTIHGMLHHDPNLIVAWIDAHADANTPSSSPTGNMHGMPLSWLMGAREGAPWWMRNFLKPKNLIYIGVREMDSYERMLVQELDIPIITPEDVSSDKLEYIIKKELHRIDPQKKLSLHISLDVDCLDSSLIECTGTKVKGGIDHSHVEDIFKILKSSRPIKSAEIVEINPALGSTVEAEELCRWSRQLFQSLETQGQKPWLTQHPAESNFFPYFR